MLTQALDDGNFDTLADPRLDKNYDLTEMTRMVTCAAVCVRHLARRRPRMSQVPSNCKTSILYIHCSCMTTFRFACGKELSELRSKVKFLL